MDGANKEINSGTRRGEQMTDRSVGFIGLGHMGFGMAKNLVQAGVHLVVWDLDKHPEQLLMKEGATVAIDAADVARAVDILFLCVPTDKESEIVLFGDSGVVAADRGLAVVDTTTMNRGAAVRLAERAEAGGLSYSDCPVSGLPIRAENGTLTMMFGGQNERFTEIKPYLDIMGEFVVHCGDVGQGQLMKAVNNIIYDINIAALAEVMPLAVKAGLEPQTLANVLTTGSARSFAGEYFVPKILKGQFEGDFSLQAAYKDIVNIQEAAVECEAQLPMVSAMVSKYQAAIDMGYGDEPKSSMIKVHEKELDQKVRLTLP